MRRSFEKRAVATDEGRALGLSVERIDSRTVAGSMYLTREQVDKFATLPGSKNRDVSHSLHYDINVILICEFSPKKITQWYAATDGKI